MLTVEQVKNNISNYRIENGIVIDKKTNQQVHDENKILEVKSSVLVYRDARSLYERRLRGAPEDYNVYINKALKMYGLNGEENDYPQNKVIREIIEKDGLIQIDYGGNDLLTSEKFSFLCEPKKNYGMAVINYIAHQRGLDITNLDVTIDLSEFKKMGVSKVNIKYDKNLYESSKEHLEGNQSSYHYPMAKELNELEEQKKIAKQHNDEDAYRYAQSNIDRIIKNNQASVSPEKWNSMNIGEQISFVKLKINESKILHEKDAFDYWNATLNNLEKKVQNSPNDSENDYERNFDVMINNLKDQTLQISTEYKQMLLDGYIDDDELSTLINELKDLVDNAISIKSKFWKIKASILEVK